MHIFFRFSALLKIVLLTWLTGLIVGFWAGQHVAAVPATPPAASFRSVPETAGTEFGRGGEFHGAAHPRDLRLASRLVRLTAVPGPDDR
jgi:hypothetical protein